MAGAENPLPEFLSSYIAAAKSHSVANAPVNRQQKYPLVILCHGAYGYASYHFFNKAYITLSACQKFIVWLENLSLAMDSLWSLHFIETVRQVQRLEILFLKGPFPYEGEMGMSSSGSSSPSRYLQSPTVSRKSDGNGHCPCKWPHDAQIIISNCPSPRFDVLGTAPS